jgi:hypothetical protein
LTLLLGERFRAYAIQSKKLPLANDVKIPLLELWQHEALIMMTSYNIQSSKYTLKITIIKGLIYESHFPAYNIVIFAFGCAAMSVEQCKTANWFNVGEKDGSAGRESIDQYYSSCQKANITPNQNLYEKGYQKGLNLLPSRDNLR